MINLVNQAISAFKRHDYSQVVLLLEQAFAYIKAMDYTAMDKQIFNALYDAFEMISLIHELAVFEKNDFALRSMSEYKEALDAFTSPQGGSLGQLQETVAPFLLLLTGMAVGVKYLQHQKLRIDDFPPNISFEITAEGYIRLFAWDGESPNKIAAIEKLKSEFDALFEKEQQSQAYFLELADKLYKDSDYDACLAVLEDVMSKYESIRGECFVRKGAALMQLKRYAEAVDSLMKARVLGIVKHRISEQGKEACTYLIRQAENKEERSKWSKLMNDFF